MLESIRNRELNVGEMFSYSFELFKKNIKPILFIMILVFFPISIILSIVHIQTQPLAEILGLSVFTPNYEDYAPIMKELWLYYGITLLLNIAVEPLGIIAIAVVTKERVYGQEIHYKEALLHAISKGGTIILVGIVCMIGVGAGTLLLVIPGIFLGNLWCFYLYAIGIRNKEKLDSLNYSMDLVRGKWWFTFWITIILSVIVNVGSYCISAILSAGSDYFFVQVLSYMGMYFFYAYTIVFMSVYFLNRDLLCNGRLLAQEEIDIPQEEDSKEE